MARLALPCIACGRKLVNVDEDATNQPYNGTAFVTHGHYGSTAFDPLDGHYLEINICDLCLVLLSERVLEGRDRRPVMEDGTVVGWEDCTERLVRWWPEKETIDYALKMARETHSIDPPSPE